MADPSQSDPDTVSRRPATRVLAALGEEASGVAHDFDNTLTAIAAHATLLRQSADPDVKHRAEAILRACRVGSQVVARVRRSAQPVAPVRVALEPLVTEALEVAAVRALRRGVQLDSTLEPVFIAADPAELQHAIMNVVHNAIDAARTRVEVILTAPRGTSGRAVGGIAGTIDVIDDGHGIPEALRDDIFEAWVSTRGAAGTGLGLTLARRVARRHGGDLQLVATSAAGTHFRFVLPPESAEHQAPAERPLTDFDIAALDDPHLALVVDDDLSTRDALAELLELSGFSVTTAASTREALGALAGALVFDVVVTDLELTRTRGSNDGLALIRHVAALDPMLPIVVVSGNGDALPSPLAKLVAARLTKPASPTRLVELVQRLAAQRRALTRDAEGDI